ncbi:polysaccharide deacetylase family protein [Paenibacillus thermotolerans]|uniref:polysaccharide deacetylase family protein n=1 Tax=Paenibacillus thermotolerans TaxID=3027807 RepID=UPI0023681FD6|nr:MULTISPECIES: polysaccharide deacetylase family protein [unclassified Paenibacillus]
MKKPYIMLLSLGLLLSACGQSAGADTLSPAKQNSIETSPSAEPAPEDAPAEQTNSDPADEPVNEPEQEEPAETAAVPLLYRMSDNFIIKPIEESTSSKVVLLTFDDGPKNTEVLTSLLDTLDKHNAKAIFFVNGYRVKQHPELLTLIRDRKQFIGNHSWDHINLKQSTDEQIDAQIGDVQNIVEKLTGERPRFFRPPFGAGNDYVRQKAAEEKMLYMTWSNGSQDWVKGYDKPDKVIDSVLEQLHPGSNILMHELPWTAEALDALLTRLEDKGYGFVDPASIDTGYSIN